LNDLLNKLSIQQVLKEVLPFKVNLKKRIFGLVLSVIELRLINCIKTILKALVSLSFACASLRRISSPKAKRER